MFKIAKTAKTAGLCPAMRCGSESFADPVEGNNPFKLCMKHHGEWHDAGRPDLTQEQPAAEKPAKAPRKGAQAQAVTPELITELEAQREQAKTAFLTIREQVQITCQAHMEAAGQVLAAAKAERLRLKALKDQHVNPLKDGVKQLERFFDAPIEYWESAEKDVKAKVKAFELAQRQAQDAALAVVEAQGMDKQTAQETTLAVAHGVEALQLPTGVAARDRWTFEITDPNLVDRGLCKPDTDLIRKLVSGLDEDTKVRVMREMGGELCPGIKLIRDLTIINNT